MADHPAPLLITGASRGIGEATARLFAQKGHRVALLARSVGAIESLADEIGGLAIPCDVADEMAVRQAVHKSAAEFGGIGIIINNAGALEPAARILDTNPSDWTRNIEINLFGPLYVLRRAVPFLPKGGVVINVSSGAAANPLVGWSAYCASKAGLSILTRVLAIEESDARGIRVYGFLPGLVDTDIVPLRILRFSNEVAFWMLPIGAHSEFHDPKGSQGEVVIAEAAVIGVMGGLMIERSVNDIGGLAEGRDPDRVLRRLARREMRIGERGCRAPVMREGTVRLRTSRRTGRAGSADPRPRAIGGCPRPRYRRRPAGHVAPAGWPSLRNGTVDWSFQRPQPLRAKPDGESSSTGWAANFWPLFS